MRLSDFIDAILLTCIVIVALVIARILILDRAEAMTLPSLEEAPTPIQTDVPSQPTIASTSTRTATSVPIPSQRPVHTPTPLPTATSVPPGNRYVPSITPNAKVINKTPVPTPMPLVQLPPGSITIALLGSDKRPGHNDYRTDTIVLVNVNPNLPAVTMLSIPRDLWVYIPGRGFNKVNVADEFGELYKFPGGGPGLLKQTIEYNLGIHVDYYARVDFAGFMKIVDTLGGIDVIANCPLEDIFPDNPITEDRTVTGTISIKPGVVHLDGKHALWYVRSREESSDFDRGLRQQRVLRAIYAKANQLGLIARLPELWNDLSATVKTDLKVNDIIWLATIGARLDSTRIRGRVLDGSVLYHWNTPDTQAWVVSPIPDKIGPALEEIFSPPTNVAAQAQARVEVWNGSREPQWGILAADRLAWEGYLVTQISPADHVNYTQTKLVDFSTTAKGSRRAQLASIFSIKPNNIISQPDPNSPVQYRIIVGADYQPCTRPRSPESLPRTPTPKP